MLFSEINPYIRHAKHLNLDKNSHYDTVVALDARLFYLQEGYGKIRVKDKEYEMTPSSLIIINSGTPYQILTPENFATFSAINFDFTKNAAHHNAPIFPVEKSKFKNHMLVDYNVFSDLPVLSEVLFIKSIPQIQKNLNTIIREHLQKLLYYENRTGHILAQVITECVRFYEIGNIVLENERANSIISYIHENFRQNLTNTSIGNFFGYHPNYISSLVGRLTGMPIHRYIIHVRLTNAASLLENTLLSCEEIATGCGFCDLAHFSRCFKKHFGVNPLKYRNARL